MKILDFKSTSVQEKISIENTIQNVKTKTNNNSNSALVSQDINIRNFKDTIIKLKVDEDLDVNTIVKLRAEINSNKISSEIIADSMINYMKNNSWHKKL